MIPRLVVALIFATLLGCSNSSVEWAGMPEIDFHGVKFVLPQNGKGKCAITPDSFTWQRDSTTLVFRDVDGVLIEIQRNGKNIGMSRRGETVTFADDGSIADQR
jgi:hypothetical protein